MAEQTLDTLFHETLKDIYYAENKITKALPKMASKATDPALRSGFEQHLRETEGQIQRLEQVFGMLGLAAKSVDCPAIDGIVQESDEIAADIDAGRVQFVHDGSDGRWASFEVVVVDGAGAASGPAQTVKAAVLPK